MKIEDIEKEWMDDSVIDETDLSKESLAIPRLHSKWHNILNLLNRELYGLSIRKDEMELLLEGYFSKTLTQEELDASGFGEFPDKRILKSDISKYIQTNQEMVKLNIRIALQQDKISFVKDIIRQIHNRSFQIRDAISFLTFQAGGYAN